MENTNKKETKIPAKSKLENKSLRKKLGHPAGLPNRNSKEYVQAKARRKLKSLKGEKRITNENPHQRTKSCDQTPKSEVFDGRVQETTVIPQPLHTLLER